MNIGMIYSENRPFPPDIRIEKEIRSLSGEGHRISVLAPRVPKDAAVEEILPTGQARIHRVNIEEPNLLARLSQLFLLSYPNWVDHLFTFIKNYSLDLLHVHDLYLLPTSLQVGRVKGVPVIADLHENLPAARKAYRSEFSPIKRLMHATAFNYTLWRWHEAKALHDCARTIVVVPEAASRLIEYGIPQEKIVIVSNTEDETTFPFRPENADPVILGKYRSRWVVNYIGGISPHRGLDTVIRALPKLRSQIHNLLLLIVGADPISRRKITKLANQLNVADCIDVIDWQPFEKIHSFIQASNVCLVPHNNFEHTQTTVPHKLFQYMMYSKPVLVSNCKPLARIVGETLCGLIFEADNCDDLASKLSELYQDPQQSKILGMNGYRAATGRYAWRHDAKRLTDMYANLSS